MVECLCVSVSSLRVESILRLLLVVAAMSGSPARAEKPGIEFGPLRIESLRLGDALGWRVTAPIVSDGLVGRVCMVRFRLRQGEKQWEETRKRAVSVPEWEETSFYKRSFLGSEFDTRKPIQVSFALIDLVDQRELGSVQGELPGESAPPLVVEHVKVVHLGRVVFEGRVDLAATWERIQRGERLAGERGDGATYRGAKLPKRPSGYWIEWIQPTEGIRGTGPQRVIVGKGGEIFYTPDGHKTFVQVR
jgi:filamentous hemagglutinin